MDRINHSSAEQDKFGPGKHGWTNGSPTVPGSGTIPQENWFDGVQEEIANIIEAAGITLSDVDLTQLLQSIVLAVGDTMTGTLNFDIASDDTARINETGGLLSGDRRLLFRSGDMRIYHGVTVFNNDIAFAYDATYDNATGLWSGGVNSRIAIFDPVSASISMSNSLVSGSFTDTVSLSLTSAFPAVAAPHVAYHMGVSKVVGRVDVTNGVAYTQAGSLGIESVATDSTYITVLFDQPFASSTFFTQISNSFIGSDHNYPSAASSPSGVLIQPLTGAGGPIVPNDVNTNLSFNIDVKGIHA